MTELVERLKTPEECNALAKNAFKLGRMDLVLEARRKAIELKVKAYAVTNNLELENIESECLSAIFTYEDVLELKNGKKTRASGTWTMIKRYGIIKTIERVVNREEETMGYDGLLKMGLQDYAFEAVVLRYPDQFSPEAVGHSKIRVDQWKNAQAV